MISQTERILMRKCILRAIYVQQDTCTHLRKPEPARPFKKIPEQHQSRTSKALDLPFHPFQISWEEDFDECWGGHHLVRL